MEEYKCSSSLLLETDINTQKRQKCCIIYFPRSHHPVQPDVPSLMLLIYR